MLINYYLIKNEYIILDNNYLLPNLYIYYIDEYSIRIIFNKKYLIENNIFIDNIIKIKLFSIDKLSNEIIIFNNNLDYIDIKSKIFIEYYTNIIPKFIPPRNYYIIKNNYYILNNYKLYDFNIVIYYIDKNEANILIRRLDSESGWNDELNIIIESLDKKRKEIIFIEKSNINWVFINVKTNIFLDKNDYILNNEQNIEKNIFQTGMTNKFKNILHYNSVLSFIDMNPDYYYYYYDNKDSRYFLRKYFDKSINDAYDILVPGAYKADLLRYCLIYIYGGCYFDCKQILRTPIRNIIKKDDKLLLCKDIIEDGVLNAVILGSKGLESIKISIDECKNNIINNDKTCPLSITGPRFLYKILKKYRYINDKIFILQNYRPEYDKDDYHTDYFNNNIRLISNNEIILSRFYKGYYNDYLNVNHYGKLFYDNEIYYKNIVNINDYIKIMVYPNSYNDIYNFNYFEKEEKVVIKNITNKSWGYNLVLLIINYKTNEEKTVNIGPSNNQYKEVMIN